MTSVYCDADFLAVYKQKQKIFGVFPSDGRSGSARISAVAKIAVVIFGTFLSSVGVILKATIRGICRALKPVKGA